MPSWRAVRVALRRQIAGALVLCLLLVVTGKGSPSAEAAQFTRLLLHVMASTTLTLTIVQDAGQCPLVNSGSSYAALDLGAGSTSAHTSSCATYGVTGNTFSLATTFGVIATCSGACGSAYTLKASVAAIPTGITDTYGAATLTTASPGATVSSSDTYGTTENSLYTLSVKTNRATAGNIQRLITFTVSDNSTPTATATAVINVESIFEPGISIFFSQDASGAAMSGGAFAALLDFGTVSAYGGTLTPHVTRSNVTSTSFTLSTPFDVNVENGGDATSTSYTLQAALSSVETGITYELNSTSLTTTNQNIATTGAYSTPTAYTLSLIILTAGSGSGGPAVGTAISDTIDFTATAN